MNPRNAPVLLATILALVSTPIGLPGQDAPEKYAWYFENFGSDPCFESLPWYTWDRYRETYLGIPAKPESNLGFDAALYEAAFKERIGKTGNCFGFCVLSLLMNDRGGHLGFCA